MRLGIAMLVGAGFMFALGTGLQQWSDQNEAAKTELRRPAWAEKRVEDTRRDENGLSEEFERLVDKSQSQNEIQPVSHQIEESLRAELRDIELMRLQLDRKKAHIESQLQTAVAVATATRTVGAVPPPTPDEMHRQEVLKQFYREISADSATAMVSDFIEAGQTESAMSVLEMIDNRKTSRVLAAIAPKRPQIALMLTDRLVHQRTK